MTNKHLSLRQQEEFLIDQPSPVILHHLAECVECRAAVERLQVGLRSFRDAGVAWSAECLAARPQLWVVAPPRKRFASAFQWTVAAALPLVLLICALLGLHLAGTPAAPTQAKISDDALLEQVDEQLSVAVPSSMESLTHLVSTDSSHPSDAAAEARRSNHIVQTN